MPPRTYETLSLDLRAGVLTLALNRPHVLNALSPQLLEELRLSLIHI